MKYVVVLGDGMADRPLPELGGKTPLQAAKKPNMDLLAKKGRSGMLKTLRDDMPYGSDIANLSILGYNPKRHYPGGRGPLEAAALGIELGAGDLAFRCNLITESDGVIADYSGGHVSSAEARELIEAVEKALGSKDRRFHPGVGYRHIMVLRKAGIQPEDIECTPPHDVVGRKVEDNLINARNGKAREIAEELNRLTAESKKILSNHPVNQKRVKEGKKPADMIWLWGCGVKPELPSFREKYGVSGSLISAVDLLRGIARFIGLDVVEVPGATGYFDTDYKAKAEYALKALEEKDFVYVHVEAPDEAGHVGDAKEKIKAIESIDREIVARLMENLSGKDYTIAVLPDHSTPVEVRTHTAEPVPFVVYRSGEEGDGLSSYDEESAKKGSYGLMDGPAFMGEFIKKGK